MIRQVELPGVSGAQVVAVDTARGNRPVAFVTLNSAAVFDEVAATGAPLSTTAFKAHLQRRYGART